MIRANLLQAFLVLGSTAVGASASADTVSQFKRYVGYTIVDVKTIVGWRDPDGKQGQAFEGCNYGRVIIFDDQKAATCSEYSYHYAYRPEAVILYKQGNFKMIVEDESFDLQR